MSYTKIQPRMGTRYEWFTMNPVLAERELAIECPDSGIGTGLCRIKFGDGFKRYTELPYALDGASASCILGGNAFSGNLIQIRSDTHENWLLANPVLEENELVYDITYGCFYIGDGVSRFNQLTPAGKQLVYDFGDEEKDNIIGPKATASGTQGDALSTLSDLMSDALSNMIEPQPIDGKPFILDPVSPVNKDEEQAEAVQIRPKYQIPAENVKVDVEVEREEEMTE